MEKTQSIRKAVLDILAEHEGFIFGGQVDEKIRAMLGAKASNVSRRCRELYEEGQIERRLVQVDGKGPHVVQYARKIQADLPL